MAEKKEIIVIFPFMAQGHIIPSLALALQLEQKGYQITFINTPLNIKNLKPTVPPTSTIRLLEIPFNGSDHGLPSGAENTDSLPQNLRLSLFQASLSLIPSFKTLLSDLISGGAPPLCVIADMFFGWTAEITHEFNIFHVLFSGSGGFGLACFYSLLMNLPHKKTDAVEFTLPDFQEAGKFHVTQLANSLLKADGNDSSLNKVQFTFSSWMKSDGILFNTVEEFDTIGLNYFRNKLHLMVWPIGPILLHNRAQAVKKSGTNQDFIINFLDSKPSNSVLYISFGSQNTLSASQMTQLAKALERSKNNFIWVVRPPLGFDINLEYKPEEWLPEGFVSRNEEKNKGIIVTKWAPQLEILSHKAMAAFMSHCGWNSVLESLSHGVPIIGWPLAGEQFYNAKMLEEVGICVEVARGNSFEIRCEDILDKIEVVMGENGKGEEMRKKAWEVKDIIEDAVRDEDGYRGSSVKGLEEFLEAASLSKEKVIGGGA